MDRLSCFWLSLIAVFALFATRADGQAVVWEETFTGQTGKGIAEGPVTNMTDITKWSVAVHDALPTNGYFMVVTNTSPKNEFFEGYRLDGECVWQTEIIDISSAGPVDLSLLVQKVGTMAMSDTVEILYKLDSSNEVRFANNGLLGGNYTTNNWITSSQEYLSGTSLQIVVRMKTSPAEKKHRIDNVRVAESSVVPDSPPVLTVDNGETNRFAMVGDTVQFTLTATENLLDAPTDTITLWAEGLPANATFQATNGLSPLSQVFSWTPGAPGIETVAFYAGDKDGTNRLDISITVSQPGKIWINEIHYDNIGIDTNEGVEIAGPAGYNLNGYKLYFYNGSDGKVVNPVLTLSGNIDNEGDGFGAVWFPRVGIQNDMEGMALVRESGGETNVLQFLTYEGSFVAMDGPATGLTGVDIGVVQSNTTTPIDETLQLTGKGKVYADFAWVGPVAHSRGSLNAGQQIVRPGFVFIVR